MRAIRRRSSTAQSSANNARASRIAKAVEVQGNGALAILNSNDNASEATKSLLNARAVTRYLPGCSPSIVNCESRDNFCLMDAPFRVYQRERILKLLGKVRLLIAAKSSSKLFWGYSR